MYRKIAYLLTMFFLCLGVYSCKSPEAPEPEPEPNYEYRYNIEVIFTHAAEQRNPNWQTLYCYFYDPALGSPPRYDSESIQMERLRNNRYRCYITKAFIQTPSHPTMHYVVIWFDKNEDTIMPTSDNIYVQGADDHEVEITDWATFYKFRLYFRMTKD